MGDSSSNTNSSAACCKNDSLQYRAKLPAIYHCTCLDCDHMNFIDHYNLKSDAKICFHTSEFSHLLLRCDIIVECRQNNQVSFTWFKKQKTFPKYGRMEDAEVSIIGRSQSFEQFESCLDNLLLSYNIHAWELLQHSSSSYLIWERL